MSFKFLNKPHLRLIISYHNETSGSIFKYAFGLIEFKNFSNKKFSLLKKFLNEKCKDEYKINQKQPYIHSASNLDKIEYGDDCIRYSYVDIYFMSVDDLANLKIRWKPFTFDR